MKIIIKTKDYQRQIVRLFRTYKRIAFVCETLAPDTEMGAHLLAHKDRIRYGLIGVRHHATPPKIMTAFAAHPQIRFNYHPTQGIYANIFLFWNKKSWEILMGSAHFPTKYRGDFCQAVLHLSHKQTPAKFRDDIESQIKGWWKKTAQTKKKTLQDYTAQWQANFAKGVDGKSPDSQKVKGKNSTETSALSPASLDSRYSKIAPSAVKPEATSLSDVSWQAFCGMLTEVNPDILKDHMAVLTRIHGAFKAQPKFALLDPEMRRVIAGLPNKLEARWACFGGMQGAGSLQKAVRDNNPYLGEALDNIPLNGAVSRAQYLAFVKKLSHAFSSGRFGIGVVTRLLAMKRPDQFVCINPGTRDILRDSYAIPKSYFTIPRYWDEVISRLHKSPWHGAGMPKNGAKSNSEEQQIWQQRSALLGVLTYRQL